MTNADSSSMDIDLAGVKAKSFNIGKDNNAESFVDLPHVYILLLNTCTLQDLHTYIVTCVKLTLSQHLSVGPSI